MIGRLYSKNLQLQPLVQKTILLNNITNIKYIVNILHSDKYKQIKG